MRKVLTSLFAITLTLLVAGADINCDFGGDDCDFICDDD